MKRSLAFLSILLCYLLSTHPASASTRHADGSKIIDSQPVKTSLKIEGFYQSKPGEGEEDGCEINATIRKVNAKYYYRLDVAGKIYKGIFKVAKGDNINEKAVTFTGIRWAVNDGDVSDQQDSQERPSLKLPVGVGGILSNNEIVIQNYGNAMNSYVQLEQCSQKYIRMVKVK